MRVYIGFDDTDHVDADRGTGKLARWFEHELPEGCRIWGVVRQQLLVHVDIPYTSHNSSACAVVEMEDDSLFGDLISRAAKHIERYSLEGSDPGLCVASEGGTGISELISFGRVCTRQVVTQKEALRASSNMHISGHGGTNQGIIGAAAAVGLTAEGWSGRFIEFRKLRSVPDRVKVSELERLNIFTVSLDRDSKVPAPEDIVVTKGWLRPRLWGNRAIVAVMPKDHGIWESLGEKRHKNNTA
jgi:tRNA(Ile2) C34 agmatinyltransferase TiaS